MRVREARAVLDAVAKSVDDMPFVQVGITRVITEDALRRWLWSADAETIRDAAAELAAVQV